jgi:hypothetical protein
MKYNSGIAFPLAQKWEPYSYLEAVMWFFASFARGTTLSQEAIKCDADEPLATAHSVGCPLNSS